MTVAKTVGAELSKIIVDESLSAGDPIHCRLPQALGLRERRIDSSDAKRDARGRPESGQAAG
jgi:hypothetical protein